MELLKTFPYWILGLAALIWHGYLYYDFEKNSESPKNQLISQIAALKTEVSQVSAQIQKAKEFEQSLEAKKLELRAKNDELQNMSVILTSEIDIASFVRLVSSEAKKLGLKVNSIKPSAEQTSTYYAFTRVAVEYEAVFVQLVQFLRVLSETQKINRVSEFNIALARDQSTRLVPLKGVLQIDVFRYLYTEEDKMGKEGASTTPPETTSTLDLKNSVQLVSKNGDGL